MRGEARALWGGALGLAALALFVALRLRVTTDITHFLPSGELHGELRIARELAAGEASRTMVLLLEGGDAATAVDGALRLEAALRAEPRVGPMLAFLEGGPAPGFEEALWALYEPRLLAFFAEDATAVEAATTPAALRASVARLKHKLSLPVSGLVSRVAPRDPTLILPRLVERLAGNRAEGLGTRDGRFVTAEGGAVLFLGTRASPSDGSVQAPLLAGIRQAFEEVQGELGAPLRLSMSGVNRFAVRAETAIRADIQRVSIGSTLGLVLLFLLLFGSLRLVLLVLPVVAAGFLAGTSACLALFGAVHGLTLAFGAAMIGVSIDYAVHFQCHHLLVPSSGGARGTLARLWPGLVLSAATTVVGFLALALSEFPGLRELAVFAGFGIAAALLATHLFLPGLVGEPRPTAVLRGLAAFLEREAFTRARWPLVLPSLVLALAALLGLPRMRWEDGIARLNRLDPALSAEDDRVRAQVLRFDLRRLVVTCGADDEAALAANDRVARVLAEARADGLVAGFRSLATLLPSAARQRAVDAAVRADPQLWPRLAEALAAEGFRADQFAPFREALAAPAPAPLDFAALTASPLAGLVRPFRLPLSAPAGQAGLSCLVSLVSGLTDESVLRTRLEAIEGTRLIDVEGTLSSAYGAYRQQMTWLLAVGLGAVLALVALRHRALRPTLVAFFPALLAALGTLGILSLLGVELNLLTLVALLMVVGMGVDYGVLLAETHGDERALLATRLSVLVAGTTTILGFGLLAFSDQPALFSIGATAGIGVLSCLFLAPSFAALAAPRKPS